MLSLNKATAPISATENISSSPASLSLPVTSLQTPLTHVGPNSNTGTDSTSHIATVGLFTCQQMGQTQLPVAHQAWFRGSHDSHGVPVGSHVCHKVQHISWYAAPRSSGHGLGNADFLAIHSRCRTIVCDGRAKVCTKGLARKASATRII